MAKTRRTRPFNQSIGWTSPAGRPVYFQDLTSPQRRPPPVYAMNSKVLQGRYSIEGTRQSPARPHGLACTRRPERRSTNHRGTLAGPHCQTHGREAGSHRESSRDSSGNCRKDAPNRSLVRQQSASGSYNWTDTQPRNGTRKRHCIKTNPSPARLCRRLVRRSFSKGGSIAAKAHCRVATARQSGNLRDVISHLEFPHAPAAGDETVFQNPRIIRVCRSFNVASTAGLISMPGAEVGARMRSKLSPGPGKTTWK